MKEKDLYLKKLTELQEREHQEAIDRFDKKVIGILTNIFISFVTTILVIHFLK